MNRSYKETDVKPEREFPGLTIIRTDGPVRIKQITNALGADGVRYEVEWFAMNEAGNIVPNLSQSGASKEGGGHTLSVGFVKWLDEDIIRPPFASKHGYLVRVFYPPQHSVHGNTSGVSLDVSGSRFKLGYARSTRATNPPIDSQDDFR